MEPSMIRRRLALPSLLAAALGAAPARADAPPPDPTAAEDPAAALARARELKKSGDRAMDGLRFADAYAAYSDVYAVTRDPALLYNMGRALQALNRHPEALLRLETFQAVASPELKAKVPRLGELLKDIRARVATLTVRADAPGARLLVRQTVVSKLPLGEPLRLVSGPAEIDVEADGYFPFHAAVDLPGGGDLQIEAKLHSRARTGLLSIKASAPGATVIVDGEKAGFAPVELHVPGGTHKVEIRHPDHRDHQTTLVIDNGARKELDVRLLPPLVVSRWWFWASVAAAGATAGVVGYALTTERSPGKGDIQPYQIKTPTSHGVTVLHF
jgi:hypothetical protein